MRWTEFLAVIGLCLCSFVSRSETQSGQDDYNTRLWQMEDGLPHNIVQAITQTHDGYLWVGTREGLARFDGGQFQTVALIPGLLQPSVFCLVASKDGSLWVGTDKEGLFHIHAGTIERYDLPDGTKNYAVFDIVEDATGVIWIQVLHQVLCLKDGKLKSRAKFRYEKQPICLDEASHVWLFDNQQLKRLDNDTNAATGVVITSSSLPRAARSLYNDHDGAFWIGDATSGLVRFKERSVQKFQRAQGRPAGIVSVIFRDGIGNLWIGSYAGLSRLANGEFTDLYAPDEPSYRIYAIYEDKEQNIWVGSEEGLARLTPKTIKTITKKDGLALNTVVTVCPSRDGSVWISSWGGGVNHWVNGKISSLNKSNGLSSDFIMAMTECRDGSLWAGADYGGALNRIQNGQITTYGQAQGYNANSGATTTALFEDAHGTLWVGTREGLQFWNGKEFKNIPDLSHKNINALCGGADDVMWIGTDDGLKKWSGGQLNNLTNDPQLRVSIFSLYEDAEHTLWIGTQQHGLLRLKDGVVSEFTSAQGLFSDSIYAILEDGRTNLWLDSSRGIFRVNKEQLEAVVNGKYKTVNSISYSKSDGVLISGQYQNVTQPAACKSADGRLWFRTTQGVTVVDPEKITTNTRPPPVVIQAVMADRHLVGPKTATLEVEKEIVIPPGDGELEVHFAALSFRAPEKNQFRYKLQGIDPEWVDAGTRRIAYYNNLHPGSYRFEAMACNNDGVWSQANASVKLIFEPHFWQTWWFFSLITLASFASVGGTVRYITRQRMQRKLERLEQQNAVEKERSRIARDMHDELGAKLTRISFLGNTARRHPTNPAETNQQISKMSETARELILSLDQIVWAVDPENDSLENLANYICRYAGEFTADSPVQCKLKIPWKLPSCHLSTDVRHNLFLAVKEALNNAVKHSKASEVVLNISAQAEELEITISDNGHGIFPENASEPQKNKRIGRGMTNMRERLNSIGGRFEVKSEPGSGTEVRLTVPLGKTPVHTPYIYPN